MRPIRIVNSTRGSGEGRSAAAFAAHKRRIDRLETALRQRNALAKACRVALDWLGECDAGTQQAEVATELRAALAEVERKP